MGKPLLFYVIDERTDEIKYCKKRGLIPYKFEDRICYCSDPSIGNEIIKVVTQYAYKDCVYVVLNVSQCYSGYETTKMKLPKLSYNELLKTALTSKYFEERAGSVGVILKDYSPEFERFLLHVKDKNFSALEKSSGIKWIVSFIDDFIRRNTSYVWPLKKILSLCEEIKHSADNSYSS